MLHPDNFYDVIKENFIQYPNILWIPKTHGEKDFTCFVPDIKTANWLENTASYRFASSRVWMYDQEPLMPSAIDTYRWLVMDYTEPFHHDIVRNARLSHLLALFSRTHCVPIFCTSEQNSEELLDIESSLTVICYYWYHAFVARDWFRYWQYNKSLVPQDRSSATFRFLMYARDVTATRTYRKSVIDHLDKYRDIILHDWDNKRYASPDYSAIINPEDAGCSAVHLVLETLFDMDKLYLTEKIFKPIVMSQPFIIFGPPGTLQYLRRYGFRTFNDIWNEDYDYEKNHETRKLMLFNLLDKLAAMSSQEFSQVFQKCLSVIEHNRRWFFSHDFMDLCWRELSDNFNKALLQQKTLQAQNPGGQFFHMMANNPNFLKIAVMKNTLVNVLKDMDQSTRYKILKKYPIFTFL